MIIDAHSHGIHGDYLDRLASAGGEWVNNNLNRLLGPSREQMPYMHDVPLRLAQLDQNNVDMQVVTPISSLDSNYCPGDAKTKLAYAGIYNEGMAKLMEDSQGRLLACGTIPLEGLEGSWREMQHAVETLGLKALAVPSHVDGKPLDLPVFEPFWDRATELQIPIYLHPQNPIGLSDRGYEAEYDLAHSLGWPYETELALSRLVFSGIMERHPTLTVVSHHLGGGLPFLMGRIIETYGEPSQQEQLLGRVLPEDLFKYFSRFYYDTAVGGSAPAIRCVYEIFGAGQLVFATDAPFGAGGGEKRLSSYPNAIRSLGLSEEENRKIFSDNARKIFNLK